MAAYTTYGELQNHLKSYQERTGSRLQFPEICAYLYKKGLVKESLPFSEPPAEFGNFSEEEFDRYIDTIPLNLTPYLNQHSFHVQENDFIPHTHDVFAIRHPRYTRNQMHQHNYFEINYVAKGKGRFYFEEEQRILCEGEICIIAPMSKHDFIIDDSSTIYTISIRQSTFNTAFFSLMSRKDLLSYFFRTILQGEDHSNYLLFFTKNTKLLKFYVRNLLIESNRDDIYSNSCCISFVNLFFSQILRDYSQTIQFYDYQLGTDFSLVLQYIQYNYQTITLSSLADMFHYSEPHLCTMIKQNTGFTFTELIKQLRMSDAVDYLINTNLKIGEIAERIGYNSADHFSRVFRTTYKISPQDYRKQNKDTKPNIVPFVVNQ